MDNEQRKLHAYKIRSVINCFTPSYINPELFNKIGTQEESEVHKFIEKTLFDRFKWMSGQHIVEAAELIVSATIKNNA